MSCNCNEDKAKTAEVRVVNGGYIIEVYGTKMGSGGDYIAKDLFEVQDILNSELKDIN